jgi:hypothetical protein
MQALLGINGLDLPSSSDFALKKAEKKWSEVLAGNSSILHP